MILRTLLHLRAPYREVITDYLNESGIIQVIGNLDVQHKTSMERQLHTKQPHSLLMDATLPDGLEIIRKVKLTLLPIKVIVLSESTETNHVITCMRAGADGYLHSNNTTPELVASYLRQSIDDHSYPVSPSVLGPVLKAMMAHIPTESFSSQALTPRERDVLKCLVDGASYKCIAHGLNISLDTVRSHIKNIYVKLNVNSKSEAVVKALREIYVM